MRQICVRFFLTAALLIGGAAWGPGAMAQQPTPIHMTRLYTGADGLSHFESLEVPITEEGGTESSRWKMADAFIVRLEPGFFEDWHNADARRYVVAMSGKAEIEVSGGGKFTVEPGAICLAEDLTGKGHTFRVVGDQAIHGALREFREIAEGFKDRGGVVGIPQQSGGSPERSMLLTVAKRPCHYRSSITELRLLSGQTV